MNKNRLWLILDLIFLVVFNVAFYILAGTEHPTSVWTAYLFIHLAYVMLLISPLFIRKSTRADVLGRPIKSISAGYFIVEFIIGIIIIIVEPESYSGVLVFQIIVFGIYLAVLISHLLANESTVANIERQEIETTYIRDATLQMKSLLNATGIKDTDKTIEKAYDTLRTSPTRSTSETTLIELEILEKITALEQSISVKDTAQAKVIAIALLSDLEKRIHLLSVK